ncbi:MAG: nicotinate phosphoribosyltransferase [Nitrosotalea sp.]
MLHPIFLKDFYKVGHIDQYPKGTNLIFSNFTPRKSMNREFKGAIFFGLKYFIYKYLDDYYFYNTEIKETINEYKTIMKNCLNSNNEFKHIDDLFSLKYWPIEIRALPELTFVPEGCPALVMYNTHPDFFWLPNMLETILSCTLWGMSTSATTAYQYRILLDTYAKETSDQEWFVDYQAHDFSFRGLFGEEAVILSGLGHLQYFKGTDTIPAIMANKQVYGKEYEFASVPATEHSVMSAGGKKNEFETYKRLITEIYPSGILSIVSDTWDLWNVVDNILPKLKNEIMARNGKIVIRPDSGDPFDIICGTDKKGLIEKLWNIFGGIINSKGYKELDSHIGAIYGDSITLERAKNICEGLKQKGFASTNIFFGVGSYTYQYVTRDTYGWAIKSTYIEINGVGKAITKDPITDCGTKKSHSGLLKVIKDSNGNFQLLQNCTWDQFNEDNNELKVVYKNGL